MRIYISHSAGVASAPKMSDPDQSMERAMSTPHGRPWFVVEPVDDPEMLKRQVESLARSGRTVIALDVEPNQGLMGVAVYSAMADLDAG